MILCRVERLVDAAEIICVVENHLDLLEKCTLDDRQTSCQYKG